MGGGDNIVRQIRRVVANLLRMYPAKKVSWPLDPNVGIALWQTRHVKVLGRTKLNNTYLRSIAKENGSDVGLCYGFISFQ